MRPVDGMQISRISRQPEEAMPAQKLVSVRWTRQTERKLRHERMRYRVQTQYRQDNTVLTFPVENTETSVLLIGGDPRQKDLEILTFDKAGKCRYVGESETKLAIKEENHSET